MERDSLKLLSNEDLLELFDQYVMGFEICSDDYEENAICYKLTKEEILRRLNVKNDGF